MMQAAELVAEATEPVREACCGEKKEGDPPLLLVPQQLSLTLSLNSQGEC
jgi:hypothetical protein